jgi:outer membrane biogenesis lipoprotein LolB
VIELPELSMKKWTCISLSALATLVLTGCLASTTSPVGVNCDFSQDKPLWEMPVACQGR